MQMELEQMELDRALPMFSSEWDLKMHIQKSAFSSLNCGPKTAYFQMVLRHRLWLMPEYLRNEMHYGQMGKIKNTKGPLYSLDLHYLYW